MFDGLHPMDRLFLRLCERGAPIERTLFDVMRLTARRAPRALTRSLPISADAATAIAAAVAEGLVDTRGVVEDYRVMKAPWGFEPSEISVPAQIWQGDADDLVPPAWGQRLADAIPGATCTLIPGATHYLWYDHWDEIFDGLVAAGATG
jgi:pimeloyl-ACP methyl ester carboxylesterase